MPRMRSDLSGLRRAAATLAALVLAAWSAFALAADVRGADDLLAVPPLARVTDTTGTLRPQDKQALEDKLAAFETLLRKTLATVERGRAQLSKASSRESAVEAPPPAAPFDGEELSKRAV